MAQLPIMPLYTDAFIGDTLHLSPSEMGSYLLLLLAMWRAGGSLPDDDATLRRISRVSANNWPRVRDNLRAMLTIEDGRVTQKRLHAEFKKVTERHVRRVEAGKKSRVKSLQNEAPEALTQREASVLTEREENVLAVGFSQRADKSLKTLAAYRVMLEQEGGKKTSNTPLNHIHEPIREERETTVSPKKPVLQKRGTRIAEDWAPSEAERYWAASKGCSDARIAREAEAFRNYWTAKAGSGATKLDWSATWRNWILTALERKPEPVATTRADGWSLPAQSPGRRS